LMVTACNCCCRGDRRLRWHHMTRLALLLLLLLLLRTMGVTCYSSRVRRCRWHGWTGRL